jgi:hypothetical protein
MAGLLPGIYSMVRLLFLLFIIGFLVFGLWGIVNREWKMENGSVRQAQGENRNRLHVKEIISV